LQAQNYQVEFAPDGQAGFYAIYEYKPDVVLMDLSLAEMDAVSIIGKIRAQKQFKKLPMFALADSAMCRNADDAVAAGANQLFDKSDPGTLDRIIESLKVLFQPAFKTKAAALISSASPSIHAAKSDKGVPASAGEDPAANQATDLNHLHETFIEEYGALIHPLRKTFLCFSTAKTEGARMVLLRELLKSLKTLHISAVQCDLHGLAMLCAPLESLINFLAGDLERSNSGIIQCIANGIDLLAALHNHTDELKRFNQLRPSALVVDDETISRKAITLGLQKGRVAVTAVNDAGAAMEAAETSNFDLIFLDVEMPGTNGLALCTRIRGLLSHKQTPILFITALNDLKTRASSKISGANHFLIKPINGHELAVTAWTYLFRNRLKNT